LIKGGRGDFGDAVVKAIYRAVTEQLSAKIPPGPPLIKGGEEERPLSKGGEEEKGGGLG